MRGQQVGAVNDGRAAERGALSETVRTLLLGRLREVGNVAGVVVAHLPKTFQAQLPKVKAVQSCQNLDDGLVAAVMRDLRRSTANNRQ